MWKCLWNCVIKRGWKSCEVQARKGLYCCDWNFTGDSGKDSGRDEELFPGNGRKGDPCYKMATSLAGFCLCSGVQQKVGFASAEIGYFAEEISKQCVEGVTWLLLTAYSKMQLERNNLKMEVLIKKEELKDM